MPFPKRKPKKHLWLNDKRKPKKFNPSSIPVGLDGMSSDSESTVAWLKLNCRLVRG